MRLLDDAECLAIGASFDRLLAEHKASADKLNSDGGLMDVISFVAELVARERSRVTDATVLSCLDGCIEQLHGAAMDYYVSLK